MSSGIVFAVSFQVAPCDGNWLWRCTVRCGGRATTYERVTQATSQYKMLVPRCLRNDGVKHVRFPHLPRQRSRVVGHGLPIARI